MLACGGAMTLPQIPRDTHHLVNIVTEICAQNVAISNGFQYRTHAAMWTCA